MVRPKLMTIEHDIRVQCSECGADLDCDFQREELIVTPCEKCIDTAHNEGVKEGREGAE